MEVINQVDLQFPRTRPPTLSHVVECRDPSHTWTVLSINIHYIDYLARFPISHTGNRWIIVATDYLTRFAITKTATTAEATELATFLIEDGRNFMSQTIPKINNLNGKIHRFTTACHPQTNGLTERRNKTLTDMISMYVDVDQKLGVLSI
ncbi:hypothetical protein LAZ67_22001140 [Cordylochernes scorpioides]|uniref:Integrase catalytic domain-containing protein n=1 Tax=Cordylochernes scorpioides TaxID=51811 RepID=A0ABY6LT07_9ARAC|nr:hypothetical protein LAZ67_22001140 [Cordylochernes scorpioides]